VNGAEDRLEIDVKKHRHDKADRRWLFHNVLACAMVACFAVLIAGCGGPYDADASGVVTLDGNIVPRGTVSFTPVKGGPAAYAIIEENGGYKARTGREFGLPSGDYQVTIIANEPPAAEKSAAGGPPPGGKPITPAWYRTKETSGLKFTVQPGKNEINLDLTSQPPAGYKPRGR
jgi:hypothetical protein